jgi:hypothetical protein
VEREFVITYLRSIKARGRLAWQRLQAVQAIEFHRDHVLKTDEPKLDDTHQTLAQATLRERACRAADRAPESKLPRVKP